MTVAKERCPALGRKNGTNVNTPASMYPFPDGKCMRENYQYDITPPEAQKCLKSKSEVKL